MASAASPRIAIAYSQYTRDNSVQGIYYDSRVNVIEDLVKGYYPNTVRITDYELSNSSRLKPYDVVILVGTTCLSSAERKALREYVADGGNIIALGAVGRNDYDGVPLILKWQFSDSWDKSRSWEWGEISEVYQLKFNHDPLFYEGYRVEKGSESHPILSATLDDIYPDPLVLTSSDKAYNELAWSFKVNGNVKQLLHYNMLANSTSADDSFNSEAAAYISYYYKGKCAYYLFNLHDFYWKYGSPNKDIAASLLLNTIDWMVNNSASSVINKKPNLYLKTWYTRGKLWIDETAANEGNIQLRGRMDIEIRDAFGRRVFVGVAKNQAIPLPPTESYTYKSWIFDPSSLPKGNLTVRGRYWYYDKGAGGLTYVYRDQIFYWSGNGISLISATPLKKASSFSKSALLSGESRTKTAIRIAKRAFPNGSNAVFIASAYNFPDALAGAPLAYAYNAPILLTPPSELPEEVRFEIERLGAKEVYILGGSLAVSTKVQNQLAAIPGVKTVKRIYGSSRFDTARKIAENLATAAQGFDTAIIVTGETYPDALAVSPYAALKGYPILLVTKNEIPASTKEALKNLGIEKTIIVGGYAVVSQKVEEQLPNPVRWYGKSRFETAKVVAEKALKDGFTFDYPVIATGENFPDALAGGVLAAKLSSPIILTRWAFLPGETKTILSAHKSSVKKTYLLGGPWVISEEVRAEIEKALN